MQQWVADAVNQVADPTMNDFVGPFTPANKGRITREMVEKLKECATEVKQRKPHPECVRCNKIKCPNFNTGRDVSYLNRTQVHRTKLYRNFSKNFSQCSENQQKDIA